MSVTSSVTVLDQTTIRWGGSFLSGSASSSQYDYKDQRQCGE
jgi:hypothetical protein